MTRRRIAVTNLAWPEGETAAALRLLAELGVGGIEVAPARVFSGWGPGLADEAKRFRGQVEDAGLAIVALQGWLFGVDGVALFGPDETRDRLAAQMRKVAALAGQLGAGACVYGAPKTRDPGTLTPDAAFASAAEFLRGIADDFAAHGTVLAFEANAPRYGCRFVTATTEALALADAVDRPGVGVQLDTGTIFLGGESLAVMGPLQRRLAHAHASEADLAPLGTTGVDHAPIGAALRAAGWQGAISIEMKAATDWQDGLRRAVDLVEEAYC